MQVTLFFHVLTDTSPGPVLREITHLTKPDSVLLKMNKNIEIANTKYYTNLQ